MLARTDDVRRMSRLLHYYSMDTHINNIAEKLDGVQPAVLIAWVVNEAAVLRDLEQHVHELARHKKASTFIGICKKDGARNCISKRHERMEPTSKGISSL